MKSIRTFSGLLLLLLAAGCHSPRAAFRFEPAPTQAAKAASIAATEAPAAGTASPAVAPTTGQAPARLQPTPRPPAAQLLHPGRAMVWRAPQETAAHRPVRARRQLLKPQQPLLEHTGAFVLGTALVIGGVVAGLLLGGWLGLGVGAVVVLLGYYFVGIGLGGEHAWLEVFQEFFNM